MGVEVVKVSAKGQIVLPMEMRKAFSISDGGTLAVFATDQVIVLKPIELPTAEEFSGWLEDAQAWAKKVGYKKEDIKGVIKSVRRKNKK